MDIVEWLIAYRRYNELICGKKADKRQLLDEQRRLIALATDINARMPDGMPITNTNVVSKKVENAVIAKVLIDSEITDIDEAITELCRRKAIVIKALEKLPTQHYAVLHRFYIRGMTISAIADELYMSDRHIRRVKKKGLKMLEEANEKIT